MSDPVDISSLSKLDLVSIHESVVKLEFLAGTRRAVGSAFFVIIPGSPYEVIFTAGHNLYKDGKFSTDVTVLLPNPNRAIATPLRISIPQDHIKVSAEYLKNTSVYEADYGVILIPWTGPTPRRGFGFNIIHSLSELRGEATISGYKDASSPGRPVISTGHVLNKECTENQLVYGASTEPGMSGSPVWIAYNDSDIAVVAIHNHAPAPGSKGSRGSRVSPKLIRDVFEWVGMNTKQTLSAQNISKKNGGLPQPPSDGLFMVFGPKPFARLQREKGSWFNVLPLHVLDDRPLTSRNRYALALDDKWVVFDIDVQQAVLADMPSEQSLFVQRRTKDVPKRPKIVYIELENGHSLRMDGSGLKPFDKPDAQTSGVSMTTDQAPFIHFTFQPEPVFPPHVLPNATPTATATPGGPGGPQEGQRCPTCGSVPIPNRPNP